ncbi:hypothetical protein BGZ81_007836 [Podila clonocystis]|nr:hypothetical protein BGZ81_007836 [Podila clonocystis]
MPPTKSVKKRFPIPPTNSIKIRTTEILDLRHFPFTSLPPEIQLLILDNLPQHDLTNCARLNREWNRMCTPLVWKVINIAKAQRRQKLLSPVAQRAFHKNSECVNELHILFTSVLKSILMTNPISGNRYALCTNLSKLVLLGETDRKNFDALSTNTFGRSAESDLLVLVQENRQLRSFSMQLCIPIMPRLITEYMPHLQELYLLTHPIHLVKFVLDRLPECIRTIRLGALKDDDSQVDPDLIKRLDSGLRPRPLHHHALEFLRFDNYLHGQEEYLLLPFLHTCSHKLTLFQNVQAIRCFQNKAVHAALSRLGMTLKTLASVDLPHSIGTKDADLAETISLSQDWTTLGLYQCYHAGFLTVSAICGHCDHLQEIVLAGCSAFGSKDLQTILCAAKHLRVFRAISDCEESDAIDPYLSAAEITAGSEWATRSLEMFICKIEVPRHHSQVEPSAVKSCWNGPSMEHCLNVQRQVFRELAKQTRLRALWLGQDSFSEQRDIVRWTPCIWYSLEMTLKSGMGQLAVLKDLETLKVSRLNHQVGVMELAWMAGAWPKLQSVEGVDFSEPEIAAWVDAHGPQWKK